METRPPSAMHRLLKRFVVASMAALGCGLAALGFALVLDLLSLRELSAAFGPAPVERIVLVARSHIHHTGAQWGEFVAGLAGVLLVMISARHLTPSLR